MKDFNNWIISESLRNEGAEIYSENMIGMRSQNAIPLQGKTIYTVVENDEENGLITLRDQEGEELTFEFEVLAKELAESSRAAGFQALQYPISYLLATSSTKLPELAIYDPKLRNPFGKGKKK